MGERSCGCPQRARHLRMGSGHQRLVGRPGGARATGSAATCPEGPRLRSWADHPEMQHPGESGETNPEVLMGCGLPLGSLWGLSLGLWGALAPHGGRGDD